LVRRRYSQGAKEGGEPSAFSFEPARFKRAHFCGGSLGLFQDQVSHFLRVQALWACLSGPWAQGNRNPHTSVPQGFTMHAPCECAHTQTHSPPNAHTLAYAHTRRHMLTHSNTLTLIVRTHSQVHVTHSHIHIYRYALTCSHTLIHTQICTHSHMHTLTYNQTPSGTTHRHMLIHSDTHTHRHSLPCSHTQKHPQCVHTHTCTHSQTCANRHTHAQVCVHLHIHTHRYALTGPHSHTYAHFHLCFVPQRFPEPNKPT
jgi:hypothetical protein